MRRGIVAVLLCMLIGGCGKANQDRLKNAGAEIGRQVRDAAKDVGERVALMIPEDPPPNEGKLFISEVPLGPLPKEVKVDDVVISPDQMHVAFVMKRGGKSLVLVDGKERKAYDNIEKRQRFFSPDSRRIAYVARRGGEEFMVVDGVESEGYEVGDKMHAIFSPDSRRFAYIARREGKEFVVIDGVRGEAYGSIQTQTLWPDFSLDSKHFMYVAEREGNKRVVVVDGVEGKPYDFIWYPKFSSDSQRVSYQASGEERSVVVVEGCEIPLDETSSSFVHFSQIGRASCRERV